MENGRLVGMSKEKMLQRIRNRKSYQYWSSQFDYLLASGLATTENIGRLLLLFYVTLDKVKAFGSFQKSMYSVESLSQVLIDNCKKGRCNCERRLKCLLKDKCERVRKVYK